VPAFAVRPYRSSDQASWLRCRLLGFFDTDYYDDVWTTRPSYDHPSNQLVAVAGDEVLGILDLEIDAARATISTVVVHPEARGRGIATALLRRAIDELPVGVSSLDAWTREDVAANSWYRRSGFVEDHRYLHVYLDSGDPADGFTVPTGLTGPIKAFLHAGIDDEDRLRAEFRRVYSCRRYVRDLG
jgi:ribosomal protein S18 acetylase RimI-like enzyme